MATVYILDVTDVAASVQARAGFGVLDVEGSGAQVVARAACIGQLDDTDSDRPTIGEKRAWRAMRTMAQCATDPAIATVVQRAYPDSKARKLGAVASGIDRAFLKRIGQDIESHLHAGIARTVTIFDGGQQRTIAFVPASAMRALKQVEGAQDVPVKVTRALPKLLTA